MKLPEVFLGVTTGAKLLNSILRTRYHRGRKKQKSVTFTVEVNVEYPLGMPDNLVQDYVGDVERRVVNYASSQAKAEAAEHAR